MLVVMLMVMTKNNDKLPRNNLDPSPIMHHLLLLRLLSQKPTEYYMEHVEQLLIPQPLVICICICICICFQSSENAFTVIQNDSGRDTRWQCCHSGRAGKRHKAGRFQLVGGYRRVFSIQIFSSIWYHPRFEHCLFPGESRGEDGGRGDLAFRPKHCLHHQDGPGAAINFNRSCHFQ